MIKGYVTYDKIIGTTTPLNILGGVSVSPQISVGLTFDVFAAGSTPDPGYVLLTDANTVAWYDYSDLTTITKDGANLVGSWNDKNATGHNLVQTNDLYKPLYTVDGVYFSVDEYMQSIFTYGEPYTIYIVFKPTLWGVNRTLLDGYNNLSLIFRNRTITPDYQIYTGATYADSVSFPLNEQNTATIKVTDGTQKLYKNNIIGSDKITSGGMIQLAGLTVGRSGDLNAARNIWAYVKEIVCRDVEDNVTDSTAIYNYLQTL